MANDMEYVPVVQERSLFREVGLPQLRVIIGRLFDLSQSLHVSVYEYCTVASTLLRPSVFACSELELSHFAADQMT
jgi:hypothetical protein